tara:strand:+ start:132 stop:392 length:261 start_codon:yes stop_codon:yes gene_type:complete
MTITDNPTRTKANKIMLYSTYSDTKKIDCLLELDAIQYTNLGSDSLRSQRLEVRLNSKYIYRLIGNIDFKLGKLLLRDANTEERKG